MIPSILPTYNRAALTFVKGEGSWLIEQDGRRFLDLGAGIAVNALGHAHPALVKGADRTGQARFGTRRTSITSRSRRRWPTCWWRIPLLIRCSLPIPGTESCELAVKMARKHFHDAGQPDRIEIITFRRLFPWPVFAAGIAAAGSEKMTKGVGPLLPGFVQPALETITMRLPRRSPTRPPQSWSSRCRGRAAFARYPISASRVCATSATNTAFC